VINKTLLFILLLATSTWSGSICQVHTVVLNQPSSLTINAGDDVNIISGEQIRLGGNPSATDGYGNYIYLWEPGNSLDNPTSANPMASPTETTTYQLTLSDGNNCWLTDEIIVEVSPNSRPDQELMNQILIFPNPTEGIIHVEFTNPEPIESLTIFSAWGRTIQSIDPGEIRWGQIDLDLRPFGKGVYLISIRQKSRIYYKRILVF